MSALVQIKIYLYRCFLFILRIHGLIVQQYSCEDLEEFLEFVPSSRFRVTTFINSQGVRNELNCSAKVIRRFKFC